MPLTNTPAAWGGVAKTFHWLVALLILSQWPLGWVADVWPMEDQTALDTKVWLFSLHKTLGIAIFALALARILWALTQPRPGLLNADRPVEAGLAECVHWLLYGALVLVPLSGWLEHSAAEGFAPHWWPFGQNLPFIDKDPALAELFGTAHFVFIWLLAGAVALHVAGALKHHVFDRDSTLLRMLPGRRALPEPPAPAGGHRVAALAALMLWVAAIAGAGMLARGGDGAEAARLAAAPSGWEVQEGSLAITIRQMGNEVTGSFDDWTAAIEFAETADAGSHGSVDVTISIPSLTLGGVTQQAMGKDFFHADEHPTARFLAGIVPAEGENRFEAQGEVTIRGVSVPASLPFSLDIEGDTARMQGGLTLDRREFNIGQEVRDPGSLGFEVEVDVQLTATRAPAQTEAPGS